MKKFLLLFTILTSAISAYAGNIIYYTSLWEEVVEPYNPNAFGARIISNTYENGQGKIVFDGDVKTIGKKAFSASKSGTMLYPITVTSLEIPNSVTSIGDSAFFGCTYLTSIKIPNTVTFIGKFAFDICYRLTNLELPNSVTFIASNSFANCESLTSLVIPNSVKTIEGGAFINCNRLTSVYIPNSVEKNGGHVFAVCHNLTSIVLPNTISTLERGLFWDCSSLTTIDIPNSVKKIEDEVFDNCPNLKSIVIPDSVKSIGNYAFRDCSSLKTVVIPDSVSEIGEGAFEGCTSLESFSGKYASLDSRCLIVNGVLHSFAPSGVTSYIIQNKVKFIGRHSFKKCSRLSKIVLPFTVTKIEEGAFAYCTGLKEINSLSATPPIVGEDSFIDVPTSTCVLKVPAESVKEYQEAEGWKDFQNIVAIDSDTSIDVYPTNIVRKKFFNLQGQPVNESFKGIVIRNGRKVMRK